MTPTIRPTKKQKLAWDKLLDNVTKYPVFGGGAGGGKSWLGCEWLTTNCYIYPESKWFIGRNELKRLMASSYITFTKVCKYHKIPDDDWSLNGQYNYIEWFNGSRIDLIDVAYQPRDPLYERFGSTEYTGGWLEEASEIPHMAFDVLKSRIGRQKNADFGLLAKIFITCNPKKNWLYKYVYKPWKANELLPEWAFIQSLYQDNPYTAETYGEQLAEIRDKATKQRLMFGNWEYDDDQATLITYDAIIDLFTNNVEESNELYLTADIARYGRDKTVIGVWKGFSLEYIKILEKVGIDVTTEKIKEILYKRMIPYSHVVIDDDGVGGGVTDGLRGVKPFINNSKPFDNLETHKKENYQNLKTQCYYKLVDYINNHKIAIKAELSEKQKEDIIEELEWIKAKDTDKDNTLRIIGKDEIKENIGRSPDLADMMMMRMYLEVSKREGKRMHIYRPKISRQV